MWEEETATVKCPCTLIQFAGGVFVGWTLEDNTGMTMADLNEAVRNRGAQSAVSQSGPGSDLTKWLMTKDEDSGEVTIISQMR